MLTRLFRDAHHLARAATGKDDLASIASTVLLNDSFAILALTRARELARTLGLRSVNRALRLVQQTVFGVEIGKDVTLDEGVYFIHALGVVIGGNAAIGKRVRFMGNNTIGTAKDNGYPVVEDDVVIGCGARILGPVRVGARAVIGANAVVLADVPPDSVAVGIPARVLPRRDGDDGGAP